MCSEAIANCAKCLDATECSECLESLALNLNGKCVIDCGDEFWINDTPIRHCESCISNCIICSESETCDICSDGYYLSSS